MLTVCRPTTIPRATSMKVAWSVVLTSYLRRLGCLTVWMDAQVPVIGVSGKGQHLALRLVNQRPELELLKS